VIPPENAAGIEALLETAELFAVDKPHGVVVHRGFSGETTSLLDELRRAGRVLHPVHRLDRATSGVLLFAKSSDAAREIQRAFQEGRVQKRYLALVRGAPPPSFDVDYAIPRDEGGPRVDAQTSFTTLERFEIPDSPLRERRYSLVEARPLTGRFHQIRRHLKHLGHPVAGDTTYGRSEHNALLRERVGLTRLFLHAAALTIDLPGERVTIEAPLPDSLQVPLAVLRVASC
jgi:tRNA pseudouridine65 synthase